MFNGSQDGRDGSLVSRSVGRCIGILVQYDETYIQAKMVSMKLTNGGKSSKRGAACSIERRLAIEIYRVEGNQSKTVPAVGWLAKHPGRPPPGVVC